MWHGLGTLSGESGGCAGVRSEVELAPASVFGMALAIFWRSHSVLSIHWPGPSSAQRARCLLGAWWLSGDVGAVEESRLTSPCTRGRRRFKGSD